MDRWNYRVLVRTFETPGGEAEPEDVCSIIEAYYEGDEIVAWAPAVPIGSTPRELAEEVRRMLHAADTASLSSDKHRALTPDDLPGVEPLPDADLGLDRAIEG